jgi:predicted regulator of Ras-like GTPase activity (Roadblock/LC7/MglB family)
LSSEPLLALRRVAGVLGSFVCGPQGQLLLLDMPTEIELEALERTSSRLMNLLQTASETLTDCSCLRLRFGSAELVATRLRFGLLCVLTEPQLDRELLSAATQSLTRRLTAASGANASE